MNLKKTKCASCEIELQPYEGRTYVQSKGAGKYYMGSDYHDLCKPCWKIRRKAENKVLKQFGIAFLATFLLVILIVIVCVNLSN